MPGWGAGEIWVRDGVVIQHELASEELRAGSSRSGDGLATSAGRAAVMDLCRRIEAHLAGERTLYDGVVIDLDWATPLQRELAAAARAIPWGEVVSYGELAALAGRTGAARAAGSFCADNRYSLIIPCHRVVAAHGIGGYGAAGPALKRRLLALEGVHL
jgi:methylated-DNA-[protein]-cysteine S-methyltransferase